jgi:hypothetical protein
LDNSGDEDKGQNTPTKVERI